jgi:hypothetical protein
VAHVGAYINTASYSSGDPVWVCELPKSLKTASWNFPSIAQSPTGDLVYAE